MYIGKCPLTRAMYSFRTVPAINSSVSSRALCTVKGIIINPEVKRSSLFTAVIIKSHKSDRKESLKDLTYYKLCRNQSHQSESLSRSCGNIDQKRERAIKQWSMRPETDIIGARRTNDTSGFIHNKKLAFLIMKQNFDWSRGYRRFMAMYNVSEKIAHEKPHIP